MKTLRKEKRTSNERKKFERSEYFFQSSLLHKHDYMSRNVKTDIGAKCKILLYVKFSCSSRANGAEIPNICWDGDLHVLRFSDVSLGVVSK